MGVYTVEEDGVERILGYGEKGDWGLVVCVCVCGKRSRVMSLVLIGTGNEGGSKIVV